MKACKYHALLTAAVTFVLVWIGGLVTSHGAGLAVPDWPNTYGYNMFFFPISKWIGGIFYEHTHRLVASLVGLLATILALWLHGFRARPLLKWGGAFFVLMGMAGLRLFPKFRIEDFLVLGVGAVALGVGFIWPACRPASGWLRRLGLVAFVMVVVQGLLGGLRVTEMNNQLGIIHATLAQVFFALIASLFLFLTDYWHKLPGLTKRNHLEIPEINPGSSRWVGFGKRDPLFGSKIARVRMWAGALSLAVLLQLILGATMRHQHAGLAIPDFPAAYGKVWPATDAQSIEAYNQGRIESEGYEPITAFQVWLQMAHRIVAYTIVVLILVALRRTWRDLGWQNDLTRWMTIWGTLVVVQGVLGAATIWTGKSADIATLHVADGALCLVAGTLIWNIARRVSAAYRMPGRRQALAIEPERPSEIVPAELLNQEGGAS